MNFFHLISPCANIFFVLHPPPSPISFLMVRLSTIISQGRVGYEMASGEMKIPQMESLLAGYEARRTEVAIMRGSVWPVATPPGSSHWGFGIVVHSSPSCTQKETILRTPSSWSTSYTFSSGASFWVQYWFPYNGKTRRFQNFYKGFSSSLREG